MRRWWLAIALLLSLGVNVGLVAAVAIQRLRPPVPPLPVRPDGGAGIQRLADHLGLEGERRLRFVELQGELFLRTQAGRQSMNRIHRQLREELTRREPDRQRVEAILDESARTYAEMERAMAEVILETRELLTPRQQRQYLRVIGRLRAGAGPPASGPRRGGPQRPPGALRAPPPGSPEPGL